MTIQVKFLLRTLHFLAEMSYALTFQAPHQAK
jgi:hypothetical protein